MTSARTRTTALWAAAVALLLAGGAWLLWGDYLRPHEPVRLVGNPPATAPGTAPAQVEAHVAPAASAPEAGNPGTPPTQPPLPQTANAPANTTPSAAPASPAASDPLVAFRRAIEEAQARQATQGGQPAPRYNSLPEAIEAARRAQLQASTPAPQPAPGAGLNPFNSR